MDDHLLQLWNGTLWHEMFSFREIRLLPFGFTLIVCVVGFILLLSRRTTTLFKVGMMTGIALLIAQLLDLVTIHSANAAVAAGWDRMLCMGYVFYLPLNLHTILLLVGATRIGRVIIPCYALAILLQMLYPGSVHADDYHQTSFGWINSRNGDPIQYALISYMSIVGIALCATLFLFRRKYKRTDPVKNKQINWVGYVTFLVTVVAFVTQWLWPTLGKEAIPCLIVLCGCTYSPFIAAMITGRYNIGEDLYQNEIRRFVTGKAKVLEIAVTQDFKILHLGYYAKAILDTQRGHVGLKSDLQKIFPDSTGEYEGFVSELQKAIRKGRNVIHAFESRILGREGRKIDVLISAFIQFGGDGKTVKWFVLVLVEKPKAREEIEARDKERERIGQDLHDGILNPLKAIRDQLGTITSQSNLDEVIVKVSLAENDIQIVCDEIRAIAADLTPVIVDKFGLGSALEQMKYDLALEGIEMQLQTVSIEGQLDKPLEKHLFRIIQELTNNVKKHAHATRIHLQIQVEDKLLTLIVEDDGIGFDTTQLYHSKGNGWHNMRARVHLLGGQIEIESHPNGKGAMVWIEIPRND